MMPALLLGWPFANDDAPLSRWNFVDTFDSAGHCQAKRLLLFEEASKYADAAAQALEDWQRQRSIRPDLLEPAMRHATMSRAQCVAVGDPRLARVAPTWLLIVPPPQSARPFVDVEAPLAHWFKVGTYDSRVGCEVAQRGLPEYMSLGPAPGPPNSDPRWLRGPDDKFWQRVALARSQCVQGTDSRLVPPPR